ncbi:ribbon-helix-helix protein, CopG family [Acidimicrobiaceae bacterium USS-CC1]|uniref:Ribbon-helix-helix protein, CopG family n=1 Tax=Acidiferrimicrobium australe TaxID=2664430 RepID=A0ABW9QT12_9ACTN|nr:ribbon-helix-helix protein, CopG family [Acidiferrimicrobium australe]
MILPTQKWVRGRRRRLTVAAVRNPTVSIPEELDDAIRAEAYRTGRSRHEVLVTWLRETWPEHVRDQLRADLTTDLDADVESHEA